MMTIEEIHKRIDKPTELCTKEEIEHDACYHGIDMKGFTDDNARQETAHLCKQKNFRMLKEKFPEEFADLTLDNFWLQTWKGSVCWVKPQSDWARGWEHEIENMGGWETHKIIQWILNNRQHWHPSFAKNTQPEDSIENNQVYRVISKNQRYNVLKRQKWRCNICNTQLKYGKNSNWEGEVAHIDHVHPFTKRKTYHRGEDNINEDDNLQGLCPQCNMKKSGKMIN